MSVPTTPSGRAVAPWGAAPFAYSPAPREAPRTGGSPSPIGMSLFHWNQTTSVMFTPASTSVARLTCRPTALSEAAA
jgi:hypothetical protein